MQLFSAWGENWPWGRGIPKLVCFTTALGGSLPCQYPFARTASGKLRVIEQKLPAGPSPQPRVLGLLLQQVTQHQALLPHLEEVKTLLITNGTSVRRKTQAIQQILPFCRKVYIEEVWDVLIVCVCMSSFVFVCLGVRVHMGSFYSNIPGSSLALHPWPWHPGDNCPGGYFYLQYCPASWASQWLPMDVPIHSIA